MPEGFPPLTFDCVLRYVLSFSIIVSDVVPINKDRANDEVDSEQAPGWVHAKVFSVAWSMFTGEKNQRIPAEGVERTTRTISPAAKVAAGGVAPEQGCAQKRRGLIGTRSCAAAWVLEEGT